MRYIRLHYFSNGSRPGNAQRPVGTAAAVRQAVEEGEAAGVAGFVLDLRNNPGELGVGRE